jgi:hypothetical protein
MGRVPPTYEQSRTDVVVEWLALLFRIREVSVLKLGPETEYPEGLRAFPLLQANFLTVSQNKATNAFFH